MHLFALVGLPLFSVSDFIGHIYSWNVKESYDLMTFLCLLADLTGMEAKKTPTKMELFIRNTLIQLGRIIRC